MSGGSWESWYAPTRSREDLVAAPMLNALHHGADHFGARRAALGHFVELVGTGEAGALRRALAELESTQPLCADAKAGSSRTARAASRRYESVISRCAISAK